LFAATVGISGVAGAANEPKGKGGEAPSAPQSIGESASQAGAAATSRSSGGVDDDVGGMIDHAPGKRGKWFDIGGTWETHGLLRNNTGNGTRKLFNFAYFYASLNLTRNDRIRVRGGFYEYLLSDAGESGVRATDLSLSYSHLFRLPGQFNLRATVAATAPVSFYSQKAGLYTAPTGSLSLTKYFNGGLTLDLNAFGGGYIQACSAAGASGYDCNTPGGGTNPAGIFGGSIEADYAFWFHRALVVGADAYLAWLWYRQVGAEKVSSTATGGADIAVALQHQPVQQLYGFEIFLRYSPPVFYGIHTDITVALAEGDPTLGYVSRNIDGIAHFFDNYYQNFEVYGALALRY